MAYFFYSFDYTYILKYTYTLNQIIINMISNMLISDGEILPSLFLPLEFILGECTSDASS